MIGEHELQVLAVSTLNISGEQQIFWQIISPDIGLWVFMVCYILKKGGKEFRYSAFD